MSNMNPFELRLNVLKLAKEYLDDIQHLDNNVSEVSFKHDMQKNGAVPSDWDLYQPHQYTIDDLLGVAKKMYDFVLTK